MRAMLIVVIGVMATLVTAGAQVPANTAAQGQVTFTRDVAPILQNRCQVCHRPDTFAPMSLLTYEDARPWARAIKEKVVIREMPPWYIDKNVGVRHFSNDVSLSDEEIATIVKWVDGGAAKGNPADMPAPRQFESIDQWHIAGPDLVVQLPKDLVVPAKAPDRWVDVLVDPGLKEDRYLQAIETKPTKGFRVVHHAVTSLKNDEAGDPAADADPTGNFLNEYALGKNGDVFPEGAARLIKAGTKINFNVHLHSIGQESAANVALGLKFYPKGYSPKHVELTERIGRNQDLDIPPNTDNVRSEGYTTLTKPARILSFQPHMHNRGKAQCMEAIYPGGQKVAGRLGDLRAADDRRYGVRVGQLLLFVRRRVQTASRGAKGETEEHNKRVAVPVRRESPNDETSILGGIFCLSPGRCSRNWYKRPGQVCDRSECRSDI